MGRRKKDRMTRRAALGMLAGGAVLTAAGTTAFTNVGSDRTAAVDVADDPTAFFAIENARDTSEPPLFTNLTNADMEVTLSSDDDIRFDVNGDGGFVEPATFTILSGQSEEVELSGGDTTADVDIFVELTKDGERVGSIDLERVFEIPQTATIRDIEPTVDNVGQSGKYEFTLENTQGDDGDDVTIDGIAFLFDTAEACPGNSPAEQIGGENQDDIFLDETGQLIDEVIDDDEITDFNRDVTLPASDDQDESSEAFEVDRFRDGTGGGNSGVAVRDIDIVVRADDGSTVRLSLEGQEGGGC